VTGVTGYDWLHPHWLDLKETMKLKDKFNQWCSEVQAKQLAAELKAVHEKLIKHDLIRETSRFFDYCHALPHRTFDKLLLASSGFSLDLSNPDTQLIIGLAMNWSRVEDCHELADAIKTVRLIILMEFLRRNGFADITGYIPLNDLSLDRKPYDFELDKEKLNQNPIVAELILVTTGIQ
jgi:hypothetical protein